MPHEYVLLALILGAAGLGAIIIGIVGVAADVADWRRARNVPHSEAKPMDDPDVKKIEARDLVTSINQQGGITAHTVNQGPPPPALVVAELVTNRPTSNGQYESRFHLTVDSPHTVANLHLDVRAPSLANVHIVPIVDSPVVSMVMQNVASGPGLYSTNIPAAFGRYELVVTTDRPEHVEIDHAF
jgi:hypothetical protein